MLKTYRVTACLEADFRAEDENEAIEMMVDYLRESKPKDFDFETRELHEPEEVKSQ